MPSLKDIRGRIGSVRNIAQITRAMEMVAASRMKRAQDAILAARPYAEEMEAVWAPFAERVEVHLAGRERHRPLFDRRQEHRQAAAGRPWRPRSSPSSREAGETGASFTARYSISSSGVLP